MSYIEYKEITVEKITCSHPKVNRIWEWGGASMNHTDGEMRRFIGIILNDSTRKDFDDDGSGDAIKEVEDYLANLE